MCYPIYAYVKHVTLGRGHFWPKGHDLKKKMVEVHEVMLHTCTKYQGSMPYGFRQETFFMFYPYKPMYVNHVTPGRGQFLLQGH